jgi:hypothetical protein
MAECVMEQQQQQQEQQEGHGSGYNNAQQTQAAGHCSH